MTGESLPLASPPPVAEGEAQPVAWAYEIFWEEGSQDMGGWVRHVAPEKPTPAPKVRNVRPLYDRPPPYSGEVAETLRGAIKTLAAIRDFCGEHRTDEKLNHVSALGVDAAIIRAEAALSAVSVPGKADDPFEHCAKEADAQADLVEQMRGVYPGDPYNALARDAKKMRKLADAIRSLKPAAQPHSTEGGQ